MLERRNLVYAYSDEPFLLRWLGGVFVVAELMTPCLRLRRNASVGLHTQHVGL